MASHKGKPKINTMKLRWKSAWPPNSHSSNILVKLSAFIFLTALALRVLCSRSAESLPVVRAPTTEVPDQLLVPDNVSLPVQNHDQEDANANGNDGLDKCDLFKGEWVPSPSSPAYTNETCSFIDSRQNCMTNGRPDTGYLYWRWNPRNCELPPFEARRFLEYMRNKTWAFIGDSISRNHGQSLLCMLSTVEQPRRLYDDAEYDLRLHFPSYNFSLSVIWSPFLVKASIFEDHDGISTSEPEVHLDELDANWMNLFPSLDYAVISSGQWFPKHSIYYENGKVIGCHNCNRTRTNITELGFEVAYQEVLRRVMDRVAMSGHKGLIFFQTSTPHHFENAEWYNGGTCTRTSPSKPGEIKLTEMNRILREIELGEFRQGKAKAKENCVNLKLLDFMDLNLMRPDGHPGPYRQYHPFAKDKNASVQNDCLHWCLPGPIDAWNDVIMHIIVNASQLQELV